jgi:multiple sugar transport system permease protein
MLKSLKRFRNQEAWAAYLFIFPAVISLLIFTFYPLLNAFAVSFQNYNLISSMGTFIGFENYKNLLSDRGFLRSLLHSFHFAVVVIPIQTGIALGLALLIQKKFIFSGFLRTVYFIPVIISMSVASTVFKLIYNKESGILNSVLKTLHLPITSFLTDPKLAMYGVMILGIWKSAGFFMIIFLAGLTNIPHSLYEAADIDGANAFQKFWKITLPLLKRTMTFVVVITTMDAIKISGPIFILTDGGPAGSTTTSVYYIYKTAFNQMDFGYASAAAIILFLIVLVISIFQMRLFKTDTEY